MMKVFFFVVATIAIVAAQNNEVPVQQQQGVPVQNQGQQQIKIDQLNQQQQAQLQQQQILAQQQLQQQQQQQQMEQQHQGQHGVVNNVAGGGGRNLIRDKTHIQDREHIKLHLNGVIDQDGQDMSEKELELHYFKMHDYDNNMKLDGLEIMQAVSHFHHEGASDDSTPLDDDELMRLIDPILEEDDKNKDGFVDYPEFAANKV